MRFRTLLTSLAVAALVVTGGVSAQTAGAAVPTPPVPVGLPTAIEPMAAYAEQTSCRPHAYPGTQALADLLAATYPGTSYNTAYLCGTDGSVSEHYDGRAIDWMVSQKNATQKADGDAFIAWLFKADAQAHTFAMARRLGVMYIVYNNQIWGAWDGKWAPYSNCAAHPEAAYDNSCHRTHMHISLGWAGAWGRTSYWTRAVAADDFGPCRPADLNYAPNYAYPRATQCPNYAKVGAPAGSSFAYSELVKYSGATILPGYHGNQVMAVQRFLSVPVSGTLDSLTLVYLNWWQTHATGLKATGWVDQATWRSLLAAFHP